MEITFRTTDMPLDEFVALFEDEDPWAVPPGEWLNRVNIYGLPKDWYALTDLVIRDVVRSSDDERSGIIRELDEKSRLARSAKAQAGSSIERVEGRRRMGAPPDGSLSAMVADAIRMLRFRRGFRLRELSRAARVSVTVLWRIENRLRAITLDELERIALCLETSPGMLIEQASAGWPKDG